MTRIGPSIVIDGDLTGTEDVTIDGHFTGDIHVRGAALVIGQPARITATLRAERVLVRGTVHGTISAGQRIELASSARVTGDLSAAYVVIADGAHFNGRIDMGRRTIAAKVAQFKASHGTAGA